MSLEHTKTNMGMIGININFKVTNETDKQQVKQLVYLYL